MIIAIPPRHGKSFITSQLFPAWYLGKHPDRSLISASYAQPLATDFGRSVRGFISDPLHREIFPSCVIADDNDAAHRLGLIPGGTYFAVGAGASITGRGADLLLIDDPVKSREDAFSTTAQRSLQGWYESTAYTRLQPNGAIIVIATRWHEKRSYRLADAGTHTGRLESHQHAAIAETDEGWRGKASRCGHSDIRLRCSSEYAKR